MAQPQRAPAQQKQAALALVRLATLRQPTTTGHGRRAVEAAASPLVCSMGLAAPLAHPLPSGRWRAAPPVAEQALGR